MHRGPVERAEPPLLTITISGSRLVVLVQIPQTVSTDVKREECEGAMPQLASSDWNGGGEGRENVERPEDIITLKLRWGGGGGRGGSLSFALHGGGGSLFSSVPPLVHL